MASGAALVYALLIALVAVHTTGAGSVRLDADGAAGAGGALPVVEFHEYIVLGAGPGGLQWAEYLAAAGRDYVVLDRAASAGSFFAKFPVMRQLISINKVYTGRSDPEFNLRHDWNSLLDTQDDVASRLLFKDFSKDYLPHADALHKYLNHFAAVKGLNVLYNTSIKRISRPGGQRFVLEAADGRLFQCEVLVYAPGFSLPNKLDIPGFQYVQTYDTLKPSQLAQYVNKTVLILGQGNGALEVASAVQPYAAHVHVAGRAGRRVHIAWETHYVGHIRAVHSQLLESYQLKVLDGIVSAPLNVMALEKQPDGRLKVTWPTLEVLPSAPLRQPYDVVIACLGWHVDVSIFDEGIRPQLTPNGKYLDINGHFESESVPNLVVGGTLMHMLDYRKSAGGFIHGFRYLTRAAHRVLEQRRHNRLWPNTQLVGTTAVRDAILARANSASGLYQMFAQLVDVVMFDPTASCLNETTGRAWYFQEVPVRMVQELVNKWACTVAQPNQSECQATNVPYLRVSLEFGRNTTGPAVDVFRLDRAATTPERADESSFLHPIVRYFTSSTDTFVSEHHVLEDFLTDWTDPTFHVAPLERYLALIPAVCGATQAAAASQGATEEQFVRGVFMYLEKQKPHPSCFVYMNKTRVAFDLTGGPSEGALPGLNGLYSVRHDAGVIRFALCDAAAQIPCGEEIAPAVLWDTHKNQCYKLASVKPTKPPKASDKARVLPKLPWVGKFALLNVNNATEGVKLTLTPGMGCNDNGQQSKTRVTIEARCDPQAALPGGWIPASAVKSVTACDCVIKIATRAACPLELL